jgi:hypothetical protein
MRERASARVADRAGWRTTRDDEGDAMSGTQGSMEYPDEAGYPDGSGFLDEGTADDSDAAVADEVESYAEGDEEDDEPAD